MEKRAEEFVNSKASEMNGLPPDKLTVIKWLTDFAKDEVEAIAVAHSYTAKSVNTKTLQNEKYRK